MAQALRVGGDIDAYCTRCKLVLGHTILAMVGDRAARVRCNTCDGEHNYRAAAAGKSKKGWQPKTVREAKPVVTSWEALLAAKDVSRARRYSSKERFVKDDLLDHPTFGVGLVQEVQGDKMKVCFKADVKTLVHGRQ